MRSFASIRLVFNENVIHVLNEKFDSRFSVTEAALANHDLISNEADNLDPTRPVIRGEKLLYASKIPEGFIISTSKKFLLFQYSTSLEKDLRKQKGFSQIRVFLRFDSQLNRYRRYMGVNDDQVDQRFLSRNTLNATNTDSITYSPATNTGDSAEPFRAPLPPTRQSNIRLAIAPYYFTKWSLSECDSIHDPELFSSCFGVIATHFCFNMQKYFVVYRNGTVISFQLGEKRRFLDSKIKEVDLVVATNGNQEDFTVSAYKYPLLIISDQSANLFYLNILTSKYKRAWTRFLMKKQKNKEHSKVHCPSILKILILLDQLDKKSYFSFSQQIISNCYKVHLQQPNFDVSPERYIIYILYENGNCTLHRIISIRSKGLGLEAFQNHLLVNYENRTRQLRYRLPGEKNSDIKKNDHKHESLMNPNPLSIETDFIQSHIFISKSLELLLLKRVSRMELICRKKGTSHVLHEDVQNLLRSPRSTSYTKTKMKKDLANSNLEERKNTIKLFFLNYPCLFTNRRIVFLFYGYKIYELLHGYGTQSISLEVLIDLESLFESSESKGCWIVELLHVEFQRLICILTNAQQDIFILSLDIVNCHQGRICGT